MKRYYLVCVCGGGGLARGGRGGGERGVQIGRYIIQIERL